jgi:hypothetical protein
MFRSRVRQYFVKCALDGFIDWSHPFGTFATALERAQFMDFYERCGPHSVVIQDWVANDDTSGE